MKFFEIHFVHNGFRCLNNVKNIENIMRSVVALAIADKTVRKVCHFVAYTYDFWILLNLKILT